MRIAVITDAHANLPALEAALRAIDRLGVDAIYHAGDAVAIGPHPAECVDLLDARGVACVLGNHDEWYALGMPEPRPPWMSVGEEVHQRWTHAVLGEARRATVAAWPYEQRLDAHGVAVAVTHYARSPGGGFGLAREPFRRPEDVAAAGDWPAGAALVFHGHQHEASDVAAGLTRYVNPGSLGCAKEPLARFAILGVGAGGAYDLAVHAAPYDPRPLLDDFLRLDVPEREFILRAFMPRREG